MIGKTLGPYEVVSLLGAGGMGEVWKARDTRLGRMVAIKKAKEQHSERFKQEARTIAALNHPYICQLYDIGPDYLVLEYVEGKSLACPLSEQEAVRLAILIATALETAHKKGIIHRDLKPANIIVTDEGSVKLLDFGLAKLYEQDASSSTAATADFSATQAGAVLGTVAYMSPEQAQGQPVDTRSDIFSFGLVLYEMLSGRRAFSLSESPVATALALVKDEPPPLQASPSLEKIVRRCLAKQPSGRFQTMSDVRTALGQVFAEKPAVTAAEVEPSIAVLPFVNMSGDKEQEYFSDGLAEEIINALTQIPGLKVIARTSAFAFRGKEQDIRRIAEALSVTNVLEGSVRKAGNRIRITAQLINAADGSHLWSERYDREMTDIFAVQDEISLAISEKLRIGLLANRPRSKRHTDNLEAYNLYLKGRYFLQQATQGSMERSRECYEQAIALDPNYALAWAGVADYYHRLGTFGMLSPAVANTRSRPNVIKALELDNMLPEAHAIMAVLRADDYDWPGAEREFRLALDLNPKSEDARSIHLLFYLIPMRRFDEAISVAKEILELDPFSALVQDVLGWLYRWMRQPDRAMAQCRKSLEIDPHYPWAHSHLALALLETGRFEESIQSLETGVKFAGAGTLIMGYLGYAYAAGGRSGEARKLLEQMQQLARKTYVAPAAFAFIYAGLGEIKNSFDWFDKAADEHNSFLVVVIFNPCLDPLRSHPRYHALLRKMNLEE